MKANGLIGIIGGSGITIFPGVAERSEPPVQTAYGAPSGPVWRGVVGQRTCLFLARHGPDHLIPPHRVNYRANLRALVEAGAEKIVAFGAVGSMNTDMQPGTLVVPDQLLDYTWGREHTYAEPGEPVPHVDFTQPFDPAMREAACAAAARLDIRLIGAGCYAVTQGPRLETAAEINRMARDGADLVGMTAMPEAALARELGIPYLLLALVVNWAAGRGTSSIHAQLERYLSLAVGNALELLPELLMGLSED